MIADFDYNKYIDYGLTIVPELGSENAIDIVTDLLGDLCIATTDVFVNDLVELTKSVPRLRDYRTLNQIKNEYEVFVKILDDLIGCFKSVQKDLNEMQLLAFVIYKNLLPEDYNRIRKNDSVLFHESKYYDASNRTYGEIIRFSKKGYLKATSCLQFMGFSKIEKINYYKSILLNGGQKRRDSFLLTI